MGKIIRLIVAACLLGGIFARQPSQPSKPGPEQQKLRLWCGEWAYDGESYATFLGPAGKISGRMTGRLILDGYGAEYGFIERGPSGESRWTEFACYDPIAKNYHVTGIGNDESWFQGYFAINGNVSTYQVSIVTSTRRYWDRGTETFSADGMAYTKKGEISEDGKTWVPSYAWSKAVKVIPASSGDEKEESGPLRSSGVVTVRGMALPYLIEGSGVPCIVTGYSSLYPQAFSAELKKHLKLIFVDWKNSFLADDPFPQASKITMDTLADDLDEVRRQLGYEKIAILGHSWPGFLPLAYGARHREHALALITIGCVPYNSPKVDKAAADFWERDASPERKAAHKRNLEAMPDSLLDKLSKRERWVMQYVRDKAKCWMDPNYDCYWLWLGKGASMDFEHQYYSVLTANYDPTPDFKKITSPVFVANGRYDYFVPPELWQAEKSKLANLSYHLFMKSGHWPMLDEKELFDRMLIEWIEKAK